VPKEALTMTYYLRAETQGLSQVLPGRAYPNSKFLAATLPGPPGENH
jgi:hypothetical protein